MAQRIPDHIIDDVRNAVDITDVVGEYVTLKRRGKNFFGLCPFHREKSGSFSVNPELQIYHCFGCGVGGNVFKFLMEIEKVSFPEALRTVAERVGVALPEQHHRPEDGENDLLYRANALAQEYYHNVLLKTNTGEIARNYLAQRELGADAIERFTIGYAPDSWDDLIGVAAKKGIGADVLEKAGLVISKDGGRFFNRFRNRLMFPICNEGGRVIGFGGRTLGDDKAKYLNSPETSIYHKSRVLYGLNYAKQAIRQEQTVLIVEGYTDVIRVALAGFTNVVASSGTAFTEDQARLLKRYAGTARIVYDADGAGQDATLRGLDVLVGAGLDVKMVTLEEGLDPDDFVRRHGAERFREAVEAAAEIIDYKIKLFSSRMDTSSAAGKTAVIREIMKTVGRVSDGIKRTLLVREVADRFGVDENTLRKAARQEQQPERQGPPPPDGEFPSEPEYEEVVIPKAEIEILKLMFLSGSLLDQVACRVSAKEFSHPVVQDLVAAIYGKHKKGEKIDLALLLDGMHPGLKSQLLSQVFVDEGGTDLDLLLDGNIIVMKRMRIDREIKRIQGELRQCQSSGRTDRVKLLFDRVNILMNEKKRIAGS